MVNGAWPKTPRRHFENTHDKDDVWTGLEYESACDMINEGLLKEAFVMLRAIHDRYSGQKRNPWNEIEGAEHYSRAMHSWNVLLALSGYNHDGPAGKIGFSPKITPQDFKSFFSAAEGWGSYSQQIEAEKLTAQIDVKWGRLRLTEISIPTTNGKLPNFALVTSGDTQLEHSLSVINDKCVIQLNNELVVSSVNGLQVELRE